MRNAGFVFGADRTTACKGQAFLRGVQAKLIGGHDRHGTMRERCRARTTRGLSVAGGT